MGDTSLFQVTIPHVNGIVADGIVNTFVFHHDDDALQITQHAAIAGLLADFYNGVTGAGNRVREMLANDLSRVAGACTIRQYDVVDLAGPRKVDGVTVGAMGSPISQSSWTLGAGAAGVSLPSEVACVLTTRVTRSDEPALAVEGPGNIRPRQRGSGRIYIGPLNGGTTNDSSSGTSRPGVGLRNALLDAGVRLRNGARALSTPARWVVWSRAAEATLEIDRLEVDDAWDTMRSRGVKASLRAGVNA